MIMDKNIEGFEELKSQVEMLKNQLSKEEIINERLMRKTMSTRVNDVERYLYKVCAMGIVAMTLVAFDFLVLFPLSIWFVIATEVLLLGCLVFVYFNKKLVSSDNIMSGNLIEESRRLVRFKKREIRYFFISVPLLIGWGTWLTLEILGSAAEKDEMYAFLIGAGIGGAVGFIVGTRMFRKMLSNVNDVISQIEELTEQP